MLKNILFDMDGTLIGCEAEAFIPPYKDALKRKFAEFADVNDIIGTVLTGPRSMIANDGTRTNREAFMEYARPRLKMNPEQLERYMTEFYENEYTAVGEVIARKPVMIEAVGLLKTKGYRLVVTTNPLFPLHALERRLEWGGYDPGDFEFVTSYETSRYAKPAVKYYTETLERLGMEPDESLIVGNDRREDIETGKLAGMRTFYLLDAPIDGGSTAAPDHSGDSAAFLAFARELPALTIAEADR